jgi:O-antigen/teichoic acid export membrane protein
MSDEQPQQSQPAPAGSFIGNVNVVMATYAIDGALALATSIIVARELGPDGRGAYGLFVLSAAIGAMVFGLGVGNAAIYYLNKRELTLRQALSAAHSVVLLSMVATALVVAVLSPFFEEELFGDDVSSWLLIAAVPVILYLQLLRLLFQGLNRFIDLGVTTIGQQVLLLALVSVAALTTDATPTEMVIYLVISGAAAATYALLRLGLRHVDLRALVRPPIDALRPLVRFGVQGEVGNVLQLFNYRLDQYIVRGFVSLAGVGIYAVATSLTEAVFIIANAVALVLMPRLTSADADDAAWMAPVATRNTVLIALAASLVLAVLAPVLLPPLFGEAYEDSVQALWLLLPGTVALAGSKVLTSYIFSQGRPAVNTFITLVALIVTVVADLILIPWIGVNGAAIASSIAYGVHFCVALYAFQRISGQPWIAAVVPRASDAELYAGALRELRARITRTPPLEAGP